MLKSDPTLTSGWLSPEFFANPYPFYQDLRLEDPVHWSDKLGSWVLTRHEDVNWALRNHQRLINSGRIASLLDQLPQQDRERMGPLYRHFSLGLIHTDPPDHTRLRVLVNKAFTQGAVENMRSRIQAIVNELLDAVQESGRMDVIRDFAYPLPAIVICDILGLPPEDREQFKRWSDEIIGLTATNPLTVEAAERAQQGLLELRDYFGRLVVDRRQNPRSDMLSLLVEAEEQGDKLSQAELLSTSVTLLVAGHETTTHLIGNGLLALLRHPHQFQRLRDNPTLMAGAIEEFLRYDSPLQRQLRKAAIDLKLGGKQIREGDLVSVMLGSANHDPAEFREADRLDITRTRNHHVAFGSGVHFCLGAPLARLEGSIAFSTLLSRFPNMRLEDEALQWQHDIAFRGLSAFPLLLD